MSIYDTYAILREGKPRSSDSTGLTLAEAVHAFLTERGSLYEFRKDNGLYTLWVAGPYNPFSGRAAPFVKWSDYWGPSEKQIHLKLVGKSFNGAELLPQTMYNHEFGKGSASQQPAAQNLERTVSDETAKCIGEFIKKAHAEQEERQRIARMFPMGSPTS